MRRKPKSRHLPPWLCGLSASSFLVHSSMYGDKLQWSAFLVMTFAFLIAAVIAIAYLVWQYIGEPL